MIKISIVYPRKNFFTNVQEIFNEHSRIEKIFSPTNLETEYILEEINLDTRVAPNFEFDSDVIISRGIAALFLKKHLQNPPIVEIPVVGNDLLKALIESKSLYPNKKIGIIGAPNMLFGIRTLIDTVGVEANIYRVEDDSEDYISGFVMNASTDGCEVIISGIETCEYASTKGLKGVIIRSSKESLWYALTEAKRVAAISRKEQEKTETYKAILNSISEGVLTFDNEGNITVFNESAKKILALDSEEIMGSKITEIFNGKDFQRLCNSTERIYSEIFDYKDIHIVANKVPAALRENKIGQVVTFQNSVGIQKVEEKIRKKIYSKGLVAKYHFSDIKGSSDSIKHTIEKAKKYSNTDSNILLMGESGTGKELFAQSIHNYGIRKHGPFVAINCAALPEDLLESELFGYVEGAFTGAIKGGKPGIFELAHGGTIFLDEIGDISTRIQARLLRVLEEKEVMRIGDNKIIPIDIRVISATNKDLKYSISEGKFRVDLFYRLNVLNLGIPTLRERREDIPIIANNILLQLQRNSLKRLKLTKEAKYYLTNLPWEGNVRELRNVCERLVVLTEKDEITREVIENTIKGDQNISNDTINTDIELNEKSIVIDKKNHELKRISEVLENVDYNMTAAALELGISRTTLWRRLKKLKLLNK